jgi:hypothetical protein
MAKEVFDARDAPAFCKATENDLLGRLEVEPTVLDQAKIAV